MKFLHNQCLTAVFLLSTFFYGPAFSQQQTVKPVRIAVVGTSHSHVNWILGRKDKTDAVIVGIYEPDKQLIDRQVARFKLDSNLVYNDLNTMLEKVKPDVV